MTSTPHKEPHHVVTVERLPLSALSRRHLHLRVPVHGEARGGRHLPVQSHLPVRRRLPLRGSLPLRRPVIVTAGGALGHPMLGIAGLTASPACPHLIPEPPMTLPLIIGLSVAAAVAAFGYLSRFDRERAFYATVLIVVGHYYVLFAAMGGTLETVIAECAVMLVFVATAAWGFARTSWLVTAGLAAHGIFDAVHGHVIANPGVPAWWPPFCGAFDIAAAACHGWVTWQRGDWRRWTVVAPSLSR